MGDARRCGEDVSFLPTSEAPYISYCMVVRRSIEDTPAFTRFLTYYEQAVEHLNTPERLVETMGMDEAFWETAGTAFLHIT